MIYTSYITTQSLIYSKKLTHHIVMEHASVSVDEIVEFYAENNIEDYPKTKKGLPNMSCSMNKKTKVRIMKQKILDRNKEQNKESFTNEKEAYYRDEILSMSDEELSELNSLGETCPICLDVIEKSFCKLKCNHVFCADCIIHHSQNSDKCPLCRDKICEMTFKNNNRFDTDAIHDENEQNRRRVVYFVEDIVYSMFEERFKYHGCNDSDHGDEEDSDDENGMSFDEFLDSEMKDIINLMNKYCKDEETRRIFSEYIDNMNTNMKKNIESLLTDTILETEHTIHQTMTLNSN